MSNVILISIGLLLGVNELFNHNNGCPLRITFGLGAWYRDNKVTTNLPLPKDVKEPMRMYKIILQIYTRAGLMAAEEARMDYYDKMAAVEAPSG